MAAPIEALKQFWRGEVPLGRAFWIWGILGGGFVSLVSTLLAVAILDRDGPNWLALLAFAAHIPWNLVLLVGVWRSSGRPEVRQEMAQMARLTMVVWILALSVI
jgi:hypothetical protein